jgi:hypothetical protein
VLRRNADGKIEFPFDAVHVDFMLKAAQGRRAIARFHSDAHWTLRSAAPRWFAELGTSWWIPATFLRGRGEHRHQAIDRR